MTESLRPGAKHQALMTLATSGLHQRAIAVGALLIDHCNAKTLRCDPGEARLAQRLRWGRNGDRKVRRALQDLVKAGWLAIDRHRGQHGTNRYRLDWARFAEVAAARAALGRDRALGRQVEADLATEEALDDGPKVSGDPGQIWTADPDTGCPTNCKREPQKRTSVPLSGAAVAALRMNEDSSTPSDDDQATEPTEAELDLQHYVASQGRSGSEDPHTPAPTARAAPARQGAPGQPGVPQYERPATATEGIYRLSEIPERDPRQGNFLLPIRGGAWDQVGTSADQAARNAAESRWTRLACQRLPPEVAVAIPDEVVELATVAELQKPRGGWTGLNIVMRELKHVAV